jgi:hypothetical protein
MTWNAGRPGAVGFARGAIVIGVTGAVFAAGSTAYACTSVGGTSHHRVSAAALLTPTEVAALKADLRVDLAALKAAKAAEIAALKAKNAAAAAAAAKRAAAAKAAIRARVAAALAAAKAHAAAQARARAAALAKARADARADSRDSGRHRCDGDRDGRFGATSWWSGSHHH